MKTRVIITLCLILCVLSITGCESKHESSNEIQNQLIYIGDNSKVSIVASELPYPAGLYCDYIEIQSKTIPYELKIFVDGSTDKVDELEFCVNQAFGKISNMGIISFHRKDDGKLIKSYSRK